MNKIDMKTFCSAYCKAISRIGFVAIALFLYHSECFGQQLSPWQLRLQYLDVDNAEEIRVHKDLYYSIDSSEFTTLDLYLPREISISDSSIVLLIHGWFNPESTPVKPSNWLFYEDYGKLLASKGFATVMVNHRIGSRESVKQSRMDIEDAIIHVQKISSEYELNASRVYLWFFSMGAIHFEHFANLNKFNIEKLVSYYGFFDDAYQSTSETRTYPQMLVVRCGRDSDEIIGRTDKYLTHCLAKNYPLELINIPNGLHGFELLQEPHQAMQIIDKTIDFLSE